ncbi:hypothetical protein SASPL_156508 [Salvia splendens]|uniref:Uncharacterized protein n=1 Tax=Salvia splendens TaxID=180675 RepID=A0A8X8YVT9_SALSN|nr:hypothetical protein SASPL_156508 [Salvia splendens]
MAKQEAKQQKTPSITTTPSKSQSWEISSLHQLRPLTHKALIVVNRLVGTASKDLGGMRYLKAVVKETLRLHPPLPLLARVARGDVEVMGYDVECGTMVLLNPWAIGRDLASWDEPEMFRPESVELVLANLVKRFEWELDEDLDVIEQPATVCAETNARLEVISTRIGYEFDLGKAKQDVFYKLETVECLTLDQRYELCNILSDKPHRLEVFMGMRASARLGYLVKLIKENQKVM